MVTGEKHDLAVFIDFENIAMGLRGRADQTFDVRKVLERLLDTGKVLVKRAYADWSRFSGYTRPFHEAAIELIEIPRRADTGKNSADIRMCVDAMDLCYAKEHIDTFVIVSGDSDFSPLVSKLRENGKRVIGIGLRGSTSNLLVSNCDEFIFYETLEPGHEHKPSVTQNVPQSKALLLTLVTNTISALLREGRDPIQASLVKDTIKRKQPSFSESDYGYRSFTDLLDDAQKQGLIVLREDPRSGTFFVNLAKPMIVPSAVPTPASAAAPVSAPAPAPALVAEPPAPAPKPPKEAVRRRRTWRKRAPKASPKAPPAKDSGPAVQ
jgi:uncharacterized protein (TIGR00288 family)